MRIPGEDSNPRLDDFNKKPPPFGEGFLLIFCFEEVY